MNRNQLYWAATAVFALVFTSGGVGHLLRLESFAEGMTALGYPAYLMTILGVAKLLGVAALLAPGRPLLKEWAYAGFAFDLLGAAASHAFVGDPIADTLTPLAILGLGAASYALRPGSRRLVAFSSASAPRPAHEPAWEDA